MKAILEAPKILCTTQDPKFKVPLKTQNFEYHSRPNISTTQDLSKRPTLCLSIQQVKTLTLLLTLPVPRVLNSSPKHQICQFGIKL